MYRLFALLAVLALSASASAETWRVKGGLCGNWVGEWNVDRSENNTWVGTVAQRHEGGPCEPASDEFVAGNVKATIIGASFTAQQVGLSNGQNCSYIGSVVGDKIAGTYVCASLDSPFTRTFNFSISR